MGKVIQAAVVAALMFSFGCGKSKLVDEAETLRDEMCKCDSAECADGVMEKVKAFDERNTGTKVTKGDNEAIRAAMMRADECVVEAARGKTTPPADKPADKPEEKPADKPSSEDAPGDDDSGSDDGSDDAAGTDDESDDDGADEPEAGDNDSTVDGDNDTDAESDDNATAGGDDAPPKPAADDNASK